MADLDGFSVIMNTHVRQIVIILYIKIFVYCTYHFDDPKVM